MQNQLKKEITWLTEKIGQLDKWLSEHHDNPHRSLVRSDRNAFAVKLETAKFKLSNIQRGAPTLGYNEGMSTESLDHRRNVRNQN